jgi:hypothetical protein
LGKPNLFVERSKITWTPGSGGPPWLWLLQTEHGTQWQTEIIPGSDRASAHVSSRPDVIALSAVDRNGNTSPPMVLELRK